MGLGDRGYYRPAGFGGFSFFPPVIKNILIINAVVYFIQIILDNVTFGGMPGWYLLNRYFALNPISGVDQAGQAYNFQIWQLITYQFMHGGFTHILFNMFMLWMFGMEIENLWGSKKFLIFYLSTGVIAGLFQILLAPLFAGAAAPTIGASGAVFGVLIAFAMFFPDRYIYLYFLIPVKAKYLIAFLVIFEFLSVGDMSFVARLAHIGGAVAGLVFVLLDRKYNFNFDRMFSKSSKFFSSTKTETKFRKPRFGSTDVQDAEFYEIKNHKKEAEVTPEEIDKILDKISESGYQKLTEREKRILFEASKRN